MRCAQGSPLQSRNFSMIFFQTPKTCYVLIGEWPWRDKLRQILFKIPKTLTSEKFNFTCHMSCVTCHLSPVICWVSYVTCHMSLRSTAIATDPPCLGRSNSLTMHSRVVCKDPKTQFFWKLQQKSIEKHKNVSSWNPILAMRPLTRGP